MIERYPDHLGWRHNLRSVVLDDEGLTLHHRHGPPTRIVYAELTGLRWRRGGSAELLAAGRTIRLEHSITGLDQLAKRIAAIEQAQRKPEDAAAAERVQGWLGDFRSAAFGGAASRSKLLTALTVLGNLLTNLLVIVIAVPLSVLSSVNAGDQNDERYRNPEYLPPKMTGFAWPGFVPLLTDGPSTLLTADGRHVVLDEPDQPGQALAWSDLTEVKVEGHRIELQQTVGPPLRFPRTAATEPVLRAAQRVLAGRQGFQGEADYVPETALSRAAPEDLADPRAISQVKDKP
jgi:hypothetical protein